MTWQEIHKPIFETPQMVKLKTWLQQERKNKIIHPDPGEVMNAFRLTPYDNVRVVILGQDPYPDARNAHGLAFSSMQLSTPASLANIFKEIQRSLYPDNQVRDLFKTNNLTRWAEQGVLLLNTVLTVEENKPASHQGKGWEYFTDEIIRSLNDCPRSIVFMLWGQQARAKKSLITKGRHLVLESSHPSPMSVDRGFSGCDHFLMARDFLRSNYFDLRRFVDRAKLVDNLIQWKKEKGYNFDVQKIAYGPIGFSFDDYPNTTPIDWTLR